MPYTTHTTIHATDAGFVTDTMRQALRDTGFRINENGSDLTAEFRGTVPCNWLAEAQQCAEMLGVISYSVRLVHLPDGDAPVREVYGKQPAHEQLADWTADWFEQNFGKLSDSQRAALRIVMEPGVH